MTGDEGARKCWRFVKQLATWEGQTSGEILDDLIEEAQEILGMRIPCRCKRCDYEFSGMPKERCPNCQGVDTVCPTEGS